MKKILTIDDYRNRFSDKPFDILDMENRIIGDTKQNRKYLKLKCKVCENEWWNESSNAKNKGCPICAKNNMGFSKEEIYESIKNKNFEILDIFNKKVGTKLENRRHLKLKCNKDNHIWEASLYSIMNGKSGCPRCGGVSTKNLSDYIIEFSNKDFEVLDFEIREVGKSKKDTIYLKLKCKNDSNIWFSALGNVRKGYGCPKCDSNKKKILSCIPNGNSISEIRPDLIKYLKNKDDANNYTFSSRRKIDLICPDCGSERSMATYSLHKTGFSCGVCSDNISIPEKFCTNLLKELNIEFEYQKRFDWSNGKIYDFYIPSLNMIIETHGGFHYRSTKFSDHIEVQKNDTEKKNNAINNNMSKYITIDCRESKLNILKENFTKSLSEIFDLKSIDFSKIWKLSQKSEMFKYWDIWNNNNNMKSLSELSNELMIDRHKLANYLKIGDKLGKCKYNPNIASYSTKERLGKKIDKYNSNGELIETFISLIEAGKSVGICSTTIRYYINKNKQDKNGFTWKYAN